MIREKKGSPLPLDTCRVESPKNGSGDGEEKKRKEKKTESESVHALTGSRSDPIFLT